jgi:integrase
MPDISALAPGLRPYKPSNGVDDWNLIGSVVLEIVELSRPHVPYSPRRLIHAISHLARASLAQGWTLSADVMLRREVIDFTVSTQMPGLSSGSLASLRSILLRVAEAIGPEATPVRLRPLEGSTPRAPYVDSELGELAWWARTQSGLWRRSSAMSLLALGAGAGLSSAESLNVRRHDLRIDRLGTTVIVRGERSREVPLLDRWESMLNEACGHLRDDEWVFLPGERGHHWNLVTNFISRSSGEDRAKPQTQRLRSTWIVHHLSKGTHAVVLTRAAGITSLESLTRYLPFASTPGTHMAEVQLRDAV